VLNDVLLFFIVSLSREFKKRCIRCIIFFLITIV